MLDEPLVWPEAAAAAAGSARTNVASLLAARELGRGEAVCQIQVSESKSERASERKVVECVAVQQTLSSTCMHARMETFDHWTQPPSRELHIKYPERDHKWYT